MNKSIKKRLVGIDVARALAIFGMIVVNFKIAIGMEGDATLIKIASIFDGKAAATFVVLAGVGISLMTRKVLSQPELKSSLQLKLLKRSVFLLVAGLSYYWIWPADILHYYGVYMLIALLLISHTGKRILIWTSILIFLAPVLLLFFEYETGWNVETLTYIDFWTVKGFLRNLFVNGFHPVIPWTSFMLFGMWFGRFDLNNDSFLKKSLIISGLLFIIIQVFSFYMIQMLMSSLNIPFDFAEAFVGTASMPPSITYMLNGISIATVVITSCILIGKRFEENPIISTLEKTGQLALTFYIGHVIIGMGLIETFGSGIMGKYDIGFSLIYSIIFFSLSMLFAVLWRNKFNQGPFEYIMRKLTK